MRQDVFTQKKVADFLNKNYIAVILDIRDDILPDGFNIRGTPTFFVLDSKGKLINKVEGGTDANGFLNFFKKMKSTIP